MLYHNYISIKSEKDVNTHKKHICFKNLNKIYIKQRTMAS